MSELKIGDDFPEGVTFGYVPISDDNSDITSCGVPQKFNASEEFKKKKVVLVAVPGAFTPTCQVSHVPSYMNNVEQLKKKGVDQVVFIASNDQWVMSAWAKANGAKGDDFVIFASDNGVEFSKRIGWDKGERAQRYAIVVDHGKVIYADRDTVSGSIEKSGGEAVIPKL